MKRQKGFILVQVLIVVACLVALMAMMAADQRATLQATQDQIRHRRAELAARSAVAQALSVLQTATTQKVTLLDAWATLGDEGAILYDLGDATYRMQILDAASLINVNTARNAQLQLLPLDQGSIDCLLDWREPSTQPRADGAKDAYYNNLEQPYNARKGRLSSLSEMLLIKGWTAKELYCLPTNISYTNWPEDDNGNELTLASLFTVDGGSPNTQANGSPRINLGRPGVTQQQLMRLGINPMLANRILAGTPYNSFQRLLSIPGLLERDTEALLNGITFSGVTRNEGKINLNTAKSAVLDLIPGMTKAITASIISKQITGFASLGDLAEIPGVTTTLLPQLADFFSVGSDTWLIRAYGESSGVKVAAEVVVRWNNNRLLIQSWENPGGSGLPVWWNWDEKATSSTTAGNNE